MPNNYGLSFQPGTDQGNGQGNGQQDPNVSPIQSAVKLLSLRLPSVVGAQAISPQALLQSPGSAGLSGQGGMSVEAMIEMLRKMMQQSGAQAPPQMPQQARPSFSSPGNAAGSPSPNRGGTPSGFTPGPAAPPPPRVTPGDGREEVTPDVFSNPGGPDGRNDVSPVMAGVPNPFDIQPVFPRDADPNYDYIRG
jgi:hypothetical protein